MTARPVRPREYSSHCLHLLWLTGPPAHLSDDVTSRVRQLGLRRRGCLGGRWQRSPPVLRPVGNGAYTVASNRTLVCRSVAGSRRSALIRITATRERHTQPTGCNLAFGSMNVRSLSPSRLDDLLLEIRDRSLDVLLLCETWHDVDSVAIRRLRADGFTVIERARPRLTVTVSLDVNHGGIAVVASPGIYLSAVNVGVRPSTFECVAARVSSCQSSCLVVVVYHPGSSPVTAQFFSDLADLLDNLSTSTDPFVLAGDINIRLEWSSDVNTVTFGELLSGHGLVQLVSGPTHDQGGTLDVVCTRDNLPLLSVDVLDIGLSDHRMLCWKSCLLRPPPTYTTCTRRAWRDFDADLFQTRLRASALCDEQQWNELDGNGLVHLYDETLGALLDEQIPVSTKTCRRRPSNVWFDEECREAKRSLRTLERAAHCVGQLSDTTLPAVAAWRDERRRYFDLVRRKRSTFWTDRVEAERAQPHRLWRSFDEILGRGRPPPPDIDACTLHRFFDDKVAGVGSATAGAAPPDFIAAPAGCELRIFSPVTVDDVVGIVKALPDKQCSSDPMPTRLLKDNIDILAPFLCRLFCWSLENGDVPTTLKSAFITPIVKKAGLDTADLKSYRPISNLSVVSKLLERLVSKQLM